MKHLKIFFVFSILIGFSACKVKQAATNVIVIGDENDVVIRDDETKDDTSDDTVIISDITDKEDIVIISDTILEPIDTFELKEEYNIALILPIFNDSIRTNWSNHFKSNLKDFEFPKYAKKSLSFIEGMILAIEEQNLESVFNITVYDNEASYTKTKEVVAKLKAKKYDFIIGPILKNNIQIVSLYAKKEDITMISPFSPSKSPGNNFEKYIMIEPPINMHFKAITEYLKDSFANNKITILHSKSFKEKAYKSEIETYLNAINDSILIDANKIDFISFEVELSSKGRQNFDVTDFLSLEKNNTVIIPSFQQGFVHNMLTKLNQQLQDYKINVFGMPSWKESKTLRLDYFNKLNVHYSDSKWFIEEDNSSSLFIEKYENEYKLPPTQDAISAYDITSNFLNLIDKYGLSICSKLDSEPYKGLLRNYNFENNYEKNPINPFEQKVSSIENSAIHIISYKDFQLNLER